MLLKWLLVSVLVLGVQNISADNDYVNEKVELALLPSIDLSKFNVFYDLNTRMGLKGTLEKISRGPFGIGFRGVKCNCEHLNCGCCTGINITTLSFDRHACINFTYIPEDFAIKLNVIINEREILNRSISAKNPEPLCTPVYPPFIFVCVRFFDIYTFGRNVHVCIDFETRLVTSPILILHFDCVKIGMDGISWMKPENNIQMAGLEMIMPEVNGPEIYDQVDFEPDPVESPNNHASNMTPEEEDNIGQLKL